MPTYQYKREDGSTFEIVQKISDDALKSCPETGLAVRRVITGGSGVVYKGTGWYVTDYKNRGGSTPSHGSSGKTAAPADDTASSNGSSAGGTSSDSSGPVASNTPAKTATATPPSGA